MKFFIVLSVIFLTSVSQAGILFPVCRAANARGMVFTSVGILLPGPSQAEAMRKCYQFGSRVCRPLGCR